MKKFNLESALAGEPVTTRHGKKVTQLHLFKSAKLIQPLYGTIEGDEDILSWTTNGIYNPTKETSWDLVMATEKKSIWINVYEVDHDFIVQFPISIGRIHPTKESALCSKNSNYIKTIEITNEL
jgi:hypothetical protein